MNNKRKLGDYPVITGSIRYDCCPLCNETTKVFPDSHVTLESCTICNYSSKVGTNDNLYSDEFYKEIHIKEAPRYSGYIRYKEIPNREEKKELLKRNMEKLYEEIGKSRVYYEEFLEGEESLDERPSRLSLDYILEPMSIWSKVMTGCFETLGDALERIDEIVDNEFQIERINIDKELNSKELETLLDIFNDENIVFEKSSLKYHDREKGRVYHLVRDEDDMCSYGKENVTIVESCDTDIEYYLTGKRLPLEKMKRDLDKCNGKIEENYLLKEDYVHEEEFINYDEFLL